MTNGTAGFAVVLYGVKGKSKAQKTVRDIKTLLQEEDLRYKPKFVYMSNASNFEE